MLAVIHKVFSESRAEWRLEPILKRFSVPAGKEGGERRRGDGGERGGTLLPDSWLLVSVALSQTPGKSAAVAGPVMDRHAQHWLTLKLLTPEGCRRESGKREKERLKTEREKQRQT